MLAHGDRIRVVARVVFAALLAAAAVARAAGSNPNETVDTSLPPDAVAQALVGPGVAVENVQYTGAVHALGTFVFADMAVVGMGQGVILSSGDARDVVGPNTQDSFSTDWANPGNAELTALSGFDTHDAAVLEFDFTPDASQVSFQYAFASDEYSEWVNTQYNDVFAFFINGQNCAHVRQVAGDPASPFVAVAVNNINDSNPVQDPPPPPMRPDLFRANSFDPNGPSLLDLELDGITRVISCQSLVNPGVVNHMMLAIADASDGIYDSAVFIEAGSLVSNENPIADLGLVPSTGAAPLDVTATIEGEDPNGLPLTYAIDWGDGESTGPLPLPGDTATATHTFQFGGTYIVTLTVSNGTLSGTDHDDVDVTGPTSTTISSTSTTTTIGSTTTTSTTTTSSTTTLPPPCGPAPATGCRLTPPGASSLELKDDAVDTKDQLGWKWTKGSDTPLAAFGDPVTGSAVSRVCVYDASAAAQPLMTMRLPPGGTCGKAPCWKPKKTTGFTYANKAGTPDGLTSAQLRSGAAGKASVQAKGKGVDLPMPSLPLALPVTVQLVIGDGATTECWQATYVEATKNTPALFKAKGP